MNKLNLLITGAGAANAMSLIKIFSNSSEINKIVACDADPLAAGLYLPRVSSKYVVPYASDPKFLEEIYKICNRENINVIFPCVDEELYIFSKKREKFLRHGIKVIVSNFESVKIAKDKLNCTRFLSKNKIPTPRTPYTNPPSSVKELKKVIKDVGFPLCFKLRFGRGSRGFVKVDNIRDAVYEFQKRKRIGEPYFIQEFVEGDEYSCDVLAWKGKTLTIIPRRRLQVRAGLSIKGKTVHNSQVSKVVQQAVELLNIDYGCNVQVIVSRKGVPKVIEVNPRFAGTIILSYMAGINLPLLALKLALGEPIQINKDFKEIMMLRYWEEIYLESEKIT